jgi:hypothetical protein
MAARHARTMLAIKRRRQGDLFSRNRNQRRGARSAQIRERALSLSPLPFARPICKFGPFMSVHAGNGSDKSLWHAWAEKAWPCHMTHGCMTRRVVLACIIVRRAGGPFEGVSGRVGMNEKRGPTRERMTRCTVMRKALEQLSMDNHQDTICNHNHPSVHTAAIASRNLNTESSVTITNNLV